MPLHPVCDRRPDHKNCTTTMDILSSDPLTSLLKVFQDGHPIEDYVEEFLNISKRVPWKERTLKIIFWGGLDDHIYQQMPASATICSMERYIDYALCLSGSSFTVGEVADCPVDKTISPMSPTTAARASHVPTSASTFPRAKLADPPIISLRKSRKLSSNLRHSCSRSTLNQRNESILVPKSAPVSNLQFCGESLLRLPLVLTSKQTKHSVQDKAHR